MSPAGENCQDINNPRSALLRGCVSYRTISGKIDHVIVQEGIFIVVSRLGKNVAQLVVTYIRERRLRAVSAQACKEAALMKRSCH